MSTQLPKILVHEEFLKETQECADKEHKLIEQYIVDCIREANKKEGN